jgi:hypothetical protein
MAKGLRPPFAGLELGDSDTTFCAASWQRINEFGRSGFAMVGCHLRS